MEDITSKYPFEFEAYKKSNGYKKVNEKMEDLTFKLQEQLHNSSPLLKAFQKVIDERRSGKTNESFERIADLASLLTKKRLSSKDIFFVLMAVELVKESQNHKESNLVELCALAHMLNDIFKASEEEKK